MAPTIAPGPAAVNDGVARATSRRRLAGARRELREVERGAGGERRGGIAGGEHALEPGARRGEIARQLGEHRVAERRRCAIERCGADVGSLWSAPMRQALIVVPTYNERDNVRGIAERLLAALPETHVLFVDDNSPDGTGAVLDELAATQPRLHVMHRAGKLGLGTAYVEGFGWGLARGYAYLFEMDADGSHDPKYLTQMLALADDGADVVIGSRYIPGGGTENWGPGRKLISRGGSLYARTVLGVDVRDVTAGFMCWRRSALEAIDLSTITSNGYSFQIEMKYRALKHGLRVVETPIVFVDRRVGQSKMSRAIFVEALLKVWTLRFRGA
jgi:dolichol-phosphate mannosyltransferase